MSLFSSLSKWCVSLLVLDGSLWSVPALGAEPYVEGVVRDTLGGGIPYATVSLLFESAKTGTVEAGAVVIGSITDESGCYRIDGSETGHYQLVCDHLSFVSQQRSVVVRSGRNVHDFLLVPAAEAIEEVEVVGTAMQYEAGKYSIRLAESSITENKTVEETLKMLPGLSVVDDQVRLDGRPVALIYIDDREVIDMRELKALKGEYIESVEVQNQTGSAYSATKQGGIVRIRLKKNAERSDFGNVELMSLVSKAKGVEGITAGGSVNAPIFIQRGPLNIYNMLLVGADIHMGTLSDANDYADGYQLESRTQQRLKYGALCDVFSLVYDLNERSDIGVTGVVVVDRQDRYVTPHLLFSHLDFTKVFRAGRAIDAGATYDVICTDEWWQTDQ